MKLHYSIVLISLLLLSQSVISQNALISDDDKPEVQENPDFGYLNICIEPVIYNLLDEQIMLNSGIKINAFHIWDKFSLEAGGDRRFFNLGSEWNSKKSRYLDQAKHANLLGNNFFAILTYGFLTSDSRLIRYYNFWKSFDLRIGMSQTEISTTLPLSIDESQYFDGSLYFLQQIRYLRLGVSYKALRFEPHTVNGKKRIKGGRVDYFFDLLYLLNDPFPKEIYLNTNILNSNNNPQQAFINMPSSFTQSTKTKANKFPFGFFISQNYTSMSKHGFNVAMIFGFLPGYHYDLVERIFFSGTIGYSFTHKR